MKANVLMIALALALPATAAAQSAAAPAREPTYQESVNERYCAKLRESPQAYVQFIRAKRTVHNYTHTDYAPRNPGDPVRADCKLPAARVNDAAAPAEAPTKMAEKPASPR